MSWNDEIMIVNVVSSVTIERLFKNGFQVD